MTATDLCYLQWNAGVNDDDATENGEDEQNAETEDEESVTHIKNESNDQNDQKYDP